MKRALLNTHMHLHICQFALVDIAQYAHIKRKIREIPGKFYLMAGLSLFPWVTHTHTHWDGQRGSVTLSTILYEMKNNEQLCWLFGSCVCVHLCVLINLHPTEMSLCPECV